jgi:hypothetical protein
MEPVVLNFLFIMFSNFLSTMHRHFLQQNYSVYVFTRNTLSDTKGDSYSLFSNVSASM